MTSLYFMIPLGLLLSGLAIWLFVWALKGGQFEDLDSPGWGIIMDREKTIEEQESASNNSDDSRDSQQPTGTQVSNADQNQARKRD